MKRHFKRNTFEIVFIVCNSERKYHFDMIKPLINQPLTAVVRRYLQFCRVCKQSSEPPRVQRQRFTSRAHAQPASRYCSGYRRKTKQNVYRQKILNYIHRTFRITTLCLDSESRINYLYRHVTQYEISIIFNGKIAFQSLKTELS